MIVIKNVYGGSQVYIKNVFANAENLVVVYNGGDPIEITGGGSGSGDVVGPASATDNAIARFNLTTGKLIQNSGATIDDSGNITATNLSGTNTGDQDLSGYAPALGVDDNYVTDAEKTKLSNLSGTNTGDQDLSGYSLTNHTHAIGDVTGLQTSLNNSYINQSWILYADLGSDIKFESLGRDRSQATQSVALTDTQIRWVAIRISEATTITGVKFIQSVQGSFTGDQTNSIALYSYSGGTITKVAETANDANIWKGTTNTMQSIPFSSPYSAGIGTYFIGYIYNNSAQTTAPTIGAYPASVVGSLLGDLTNSAKYFGFLSTQNSLPATQAMSAITANTNAAWFGLY